jgi:hypothetical protein
MNLKDKLKGNFKNEINSPHATRESKKTEHREKSTNADNQDTLTIRKNGDIRAPWVSQKLIETLAERFTPERIVGYIEDLLAATHVTKGGNIIPDNRAREAAVKLLLAYVVGLPVQRQEIIQKFIDGSLDTEEAILASPALRSTLARKIARVEASEAAGIASKTIEIESEQNRGNGEP